MKLRSRCDSENVNSAFPLSGILGHPTDICGDTSLGTGSLSPRDTESAACGCEQLFQAIGGNGDAGRLRLKRRTLVTTAAIELISVYVDSCGSCIDHDIDMAAPRAAVTALLVLHTTVATYEHCS